MDTSINQQTTLMHKNFSMVKIPSLRRRQAPNGHDPGPNQLSSIVKALESMQSQLDQMQHDLLHGDAGEMIRLNKRLDDMKESLRGQRDGEKYSNNDEGSPKLPQQLNRCSSSSQVSTINGELCNESSSLAVRCDPHPLQIDGERDDSHCDGDKPLWPVAVVPILCVVIMIMVVVLVGVVIGSVVRSK